MVAAPGPPAALQEAATLREMAAAPGPPEALQEVAALQEAAAAPGSPAALQEAVAPQRQLQHQGHQRLSRRWQHSRRQRQQTPTP
ncbi:hypothetical protein NDU88_003148 [Pleurodeles waltl]|uniref:Uncharacterized protein n=1 Tax=Pleurodeles waltl TaxID=8319 RepID=A0AAV7TNW3_PLEWA|nr:hypothetical protein NDU88_003148 [Pleurodeles waltl]